MNRFFVTFLLITVALSFSRGQERGQHQSLVHEGNRYFDLQQYHLAIDLYTRALSFGEGDPSADYRLAEAYRKTFQYSPAEAFYFKVVCDAPDDFPLALYHYALMRKRNGHLTEAIAEFDRFIGLHTANAALTHWVEQAIIERSGCDIALEPGALHPGVVHYSLPAPVNTPYNDFAPAKSAPGALVVTSTRITSNRDALDGRTGEAFSDHYVFDHQNDTWTERKRDALYVANSAGHDGTGSFTADGERYYFSLCEERCVIYESRRTGNKWTNPTVVEKVNMPAADSKHPAISPRGDTLYFASNRPGGFGDYDIWFSIRQDGVWQTPVNAGRMINTRAREMAPAVTPVRNALFFASDGHPGYGGLDLFVARVRYTGDTVLYNLREPFNSMRDDCFLSFDDRTVWWSSNRPGGMGGFDIYAANEAGALSIVSRLGMQNRNDSRTVTLTSRTARSENLQLLAARNEETIDYHQLTYAEKAIVNRMVEIQLQNRGLNAEDFADLSEDEFLRLKGVAHARMQTLLLQEKYASTLLAEVSPGELQGAWSLTGEMVDSRTGLALPGVRVLLTNAYGDILKITNTNEKGQFRFTDMPGNTKLFVRVEKNGRESFAVVQELKASGGDRNQPRYFENIYFDFDQYAIRPEAATVLRALADWLKQHPDAQVEIHAFADDRGSAAYNFALTQKRGETVAEFLTRAGLDATGFAIIPRGKQARQDAATAIQRQYNRRVEFIINGVSDGFTPALKTYIVKKASSWHHIAEVTGIPKEELMALNSTESEVVQPFQPVCLPYGTELAAGELFFAGI